MNRSAKDGSQLCLEQRRILQAEPNTSQAEHRVLAFGELLLQDAGNLIRSNIQRANRDRQLPARLKDSTIGLVMIRFRRFPIPAQKQKLGAVQSHSVCSATNALLNFFRKLNIAVDADSLAILSFCGEAFELFKTFDDSQVSGLRGFKSGEGRGVRINNHLTMITIQNHRFATGDAGEAASKSHNGRDFKSTGQNRGMARVPTHFRGKPQHILRIECGGFSGRQVVRQMITGSVRFESSSRLSPSSWRRRRFSRS